MNNNTRKNVHNIALLILLVVFTLLIFKLLNVIIFAIWPMILLWLFIILMLITKFWILIWSIILWIKWFLCILKYFKQVESFNFINDQLKKCQDKINNIINDLNHNLKKE